MKSLWTVVSVLALANLLMLGGFVGWLASTGRLNRDRADAVRALFAKTVEEEAAVKAEADAAAGEKAKADAAAAKLALPPVAAAERIRETQDAAELSGQSRHRLESDIRSLQTFLV